MLRKTEDKWLFPVRSGTSWGQGVLQGPGGGRVVMSGSGDVREDSFRKDT